MSAAFRIDSRDQDSASDGISRYGAYLRDHASRFVDFDEPSTNRAWFALAAFEIATAPIMSPGYVLSDPRVIGTTGHWDDDQRAALTVTLVSALPASLTDTIGRSWSWDGWRRDTWGGEPRWSEQHDNARPVALPALTVRVPLVPADLVEPKYRSGVPDLQRTRAAVWAVVSEVNAKLAPVLAGLTAAGVVGWSDKACSR